MKTYYPVLDQGYVSLIDVMPANKEGADTAPADARIISAARVSFNGESKGPEKDRKLLIYLIEHGHLSCLEHVYLTLKISMPIAIARQWMRYRMACLSGDTVITFNRPDRWKEGRHVAQSGYAGAKFTLDRLYQLWNNPIQHKKIANMLLRVYDENTKDFTVANIQDIFYSGIKSVYKFTTEDNYSVVCTKDHLLYTSEGWLTLEQAVGLRIAGTGFPAMTKDCFVAVNGETEVWRSRAWMEVRRDLPITQVAQEAGCSYHTIRKWKKIFGFQKYSRWEKGHQPWNSGVKGYSLPERTLEQRKHLSEKARKGSDNHLWRGGVSSEREKIGRWTTSMAKLVHQKYDYTCQECGKKSGKLHTHHIKPVATNPELAYDFDNLITLCDYCHTRIHHPTAKQKEHRLRFVQMSKLTAKYSKIVKIEYVGEQPTYDIGVKGDNHNFLANGVIVHNSVNEISQRYVEIDEGEYYLPEDLRQQSTNNKQGSAGELKDSQDLRELMRQHYLQCDELYNTLLSRGVAKEQARLVRPVGGYTQFYWTANLRSILHLLEERTDSHAQWEIQQYAFALQEIVKEVAPWTYQAWVQKQHKQNHAIQNYGTLFEENNALHESYAVLYDYIQDMPAGDDILKDLFSTEQDGD